MIITSGFQLGAQAAADAVGHLQSIERLVTADVRSSLSEQQSSPAELTWYYQPSLATLLPPYRLPSEAVHEFKHFTEDLRSALEYASGSISTSLFLDERMFEVIRNKHPGMKSDDIVEKVDSRMKNGFPVGWTREDFSESVENHLPGLNSVAPKVYALIEGCQDFSQSDERDRWLFDLHHQWTYHKHKGPAGWLVSWTRNPNYGVPLSNLTVEEVLENICLWGTTRPFLKYMERCQTQVEQLLRELEAATSEANNELENHWDKTGDLFAFPGVADGG